MAEASEKAGIMDEVKGLASFILYRFVGVSFATVLALLAGIYWIVDKSLDDLKQANDVTNERISDLSQNVLSMRTSIEDSLNQIKNTDLSVVERLAKIESRLDNIDPTVIIIDPEAAPQLLFDVSANVVFLTRDNKVAFASNANISDWEALDSQILKVANDDRNLPNWVEIDPKDINLSDYRRFGFLYSEGSTRFCVIHRQKSQVAKISCLDVEYDGENNFSDVRLVADQEISEAQLAVPHTSNQLLAAQMLQSFMDAPPRQEPASFSLDQVLEELLGQPN